MGKEYNGQLILASKGMYYNGKVPDGIVNVEAWSTKDERLLFNRNTSFTDNLDRLIKNCTDLKITPDELILADKTQIFFYMRCLAYGGDYSFDFRCSNCDKKAIHNMDLEKDLVVDYATDDMQEPFETKLSQHTITWKLLRGSDEKEVEKHVKRLRAKGSKEDDPGYIYRLATRLVTINNLPADNIVESMDFIEKLRGRDVLTIRQSIDSVRIGINPEIEVDCNHCGYPNDINLPMDKSFFRPAKQGAIPDRNG